MINPERDLFIQQFLLRQQQEESLKQGISKILSDSKPNTVKKVKPKPKNISRSRSQISLKPQRWDYLHELDKLKRSKIESKKKELDQQREAASMKECTFEPNKNTREKGKPRSLGQCDKIQKASRIDSRAQHLDGTALNDYLEIVQNESYSNLSIGERAIVWARKKKLKEEGLRQALKEKEQRENTFAPLIVTRFT